MDSDSRKEDSSGRTDRLLTVHAVSLGTSIVAAVGLFTFLGYCADRHRGGGMLWTLVGFGLGILYMVYEFWKLLALLNSRQEGGGKQRK